MKGALVLLSVAAALALASASARGAPAMKKGLPLSLDPNKGYFHRLHTRNLKLGCTACHAQDNHDILFLRKDHPMPPGMPGRVDRTVCLSCHQAPAQPTWYGPPPSK